MRDPEKRPWRPERVAAPPRVPSPARAFPTRERAQAVSRWCPLTRVRPPMLPHRAMVRVLFRRAHQGNGDDGGERRGKYPGRTSSLPPFPFSDLGLGLGSLFALFRFDSRSISRSFLFPQQDPLPSTALIPLIVSPDRLGVDRVGWTV
jgi:hypothetical protein